MMPSIWDGAMCEADDGRERPPCRQPATFAVTVLRPPHGTVTMLLCRDHAAQQAQLPLRVIDALT